MATDHALETARNIVNQLGDFWKVSAPVRQTTNDMADQYVAAVIRTVMCATLGELLDEDRMPCRCNRCIREKIEELEIDGICPNCRHPMAWHMVKSFNQLGTQHNVITCNHGCDCRTEISH